VSEHLEGSKKESRLISSLLSYFSHRWEELFFLLVFLHCSALRTWRSSLTLRFSLLFMEQLPPLLSSSSLSFAASPI